MFRASICALSGQITVCMRHWCLSLCMGGVRSADQTPLIQSDKYQCRIDTVIPDDGHMDARNMYRKEINISSIIVHLVGLICKDYSGMHGQQNIKLKKKKSNLQA